MNITQQFREKLVGQKFKTNNCGVCEVIDYENSQNVTVKFLNPEFTTSVFLHQLRKGTVRNPFVPSFYGKGYMGVGKYSFKDKRVYDLWANLLKRVYCDKSRHKFPTYTEASVCDEWLNFQNFAAWCYSQKFFNAKDDKGRWYQLDKDLLSEGVKIYSPNTCCFIPKDINLMLTLNDVNRGEFPVGVTRIKSTGRFEATLSSNKKSYLGVFDTAEEAFLVYKTAKESYVKDVAEFWNGSIDHKAYTALLNYQININD